MQNLSSSSSKESDPDAGALFVLESKGAEKKSIAWEFFISCYVRVMLIASRSNQQFFIDKDSENFNWSRVFYIRMAGWHWSLLVLRHCIFFCHDCKVFHIRNFVIITFFMHEYILVGMSTCIVVGFHYSYRFLNSRILEYHAFLNMSDNRLSGCISMSMLASMRRATQTILWMLVMIDWILA